MLIGCVSSSCSGVARAFELVLLSGLRDSRAAHGYPLPPFHPSAGEMAQSKSRQTAQCRLRSAPAPLAAALLVAGFTTVVEAGHFLNTGINCDPIYPIDSSSLIFDFDINCNVDAPISPGTDYIKNWTSKVNNYSTNLSLPLSAITLDSTRQVLRGVISANRKITFPLDISPSKYPQLTLEYMVSIASLLREHDWVSAIADMRAACAN